MKRRHVALAAALAFAAWLSFFGDKAPATTFVEATGRTSVPSGSQRAIARSSGADVLAIEPRAALIGGAHADTSATSLFKGQDWAPPPPPPAKPMPPPAPVAPQMPFTYLGKKLEDGRWEVYLGQGDETHIVSEKSVVNASYRVDSIKPPTLTLTYLPLSQTQSINIGGAD